MQRADKHIFLFDWLYKQANPQGKSSNDGTKRLRGLIEWMNQCPSNPYNIVLFLPVGEDLLEKYAPHYKALGYVKTNHSTLDLRQIFRFWLKGVETELSPRDTLAGNYWRSDLYKPQNSIYSVVGCTMPEVLLNK